MVPGIVLLLALFALLVLADRLIHWIVIRIPQWAYWLILLLLIVAFFSTGR